MALWGSQRIKAGKLHGSAGPKTVVARTGRCRMGTFTSTTNQKGLRLAQAQLPCPKRVLFNGGLTRTMAHRSFVAEMQQIAKRSETPQHKTTSLITQAQRQEPELRLRGRTVRKCGERASDRGSAVLYWQVGEPRQCS